MDNRRLFKVFNINQIGGNKTLDLVNLIQNSSDHKGSLEIHSNQSQKPNFPQCILQ